jgi:hypothetical protein
MFKKHNKITVGYVIQEYITLPNGTLVPQSQEFIAGDQVDYETREGEPVTVDVSKEQYCGFDMKQPKPIPDGLKFICPDCGDSQLECVMGGSHTCPVISIDESGDFEYGDYESSADVDRWQCIKCGAFLTEDGISTRHGEDDPIIHNEEVVEWIKKRCKQE